MLTEAIQTKQSKPRPVTTEEELERYRQLVELLTSERQSNQQLIEQQREVIHRLAAERLRLLREIGRTIGGRLVQ